MSEKELTLADIALPSDPRKGCTLYALQREKDGWYGGGDYYEWVATLAEATFLNDADAADYWQSPPPGCRLVPICCVAISPALP